MNILREWEISKGIKLAEIDNIPEEEFKEFLDKNLLNNYPEINWRNSFSSIERDKDNTLKAQIKDKYKLRLVILKDNELVALSFGWQMAINHSDFYMAVSAVKEDHRRQGYYNLMIDKVLELTKEKGFSAVRSRHINTNQTVLIAKLKKDFIINGLEIDEGLGVLLKMSYFHNQARKNAAYYRSGKSASLTHD